MGTRLYVGNLPYSVTELDLRELFAALGTVTDAKIITDRETGRPRGFGFIEKAIDELNGRDVQGRQVAVKEAEDRRGGGGGGGGGFGGGGRGGGGGYGGGGGGRGGGGGGYGGGGGGRGGGGGGRQRW